MENVSNQQMRIRGNGKLLITGEYFVLDGAMALAVPTRLGQQLVIEKSTVAKLHWRSLNHENQVWFSATFSLKDFSFQKATDTAIAERLQQVLLAIRQQNSTFLISDQGFSVRTELEFPRLWGLGTSSTLIYALAKWAQIDPYQLLADTFGGSGYDIACAGTDVPIFYQKIDGQSHSKVVHFDPPFKEHLYFVYLEKKQNSRTGIQRYREKMKEDGCTIQAISDLTRAVADANNIEQFSERLLLHEQIVSQILDLPRAQDLYFSDFAGIIKSLGAWGGDFVLAISERQEQEVRDYFYKKGYPTIVSYADMLL
ncbi:MAG: GYDIA family GHMP kinase [Saprospiraceae bacterium]